jgi:hypothetical protein
LLVQCGDLHFQVSGEEIAAGQMSAPGTVRHVRTITSPT